MEKIGTPVAVDEAASSTSGTTTPAPQAQATNPYGQPQQQPQQVQQARPSQYSPCLHLLTIVATLLSIPLKDYRHTRTSIHYF